MGTYKFIYESNTPGYADVAVRFDDTEHAHIADVLNAFRQFLKGVTFTDKTISDYIETGKIEEHLMDNV